MSWRTTVWWRCLAGSKILIARGKSSRGSATRRKRRSKGCASRASTKRKRIWIAGSSAGADTRIHGTTKRQVTAMFAEEKPHLLPLPLEPFRYYQYGERVVHLDGCVEVEAAYYSLPPAVGRAPRAYLASAHQPTSPGAPAPEPRRLSHPGR